ncbi:MAG: sulfatase-like hydrolase/transferase, partial [Planctomycetota bacterium]
KSASRGGTSMIVRLRYADGQTEDHPLINGQHIADYIGQFDVPQSNRALKAQDGGQIRYLSITPKRKAVIDTIECIKPEHHTAPLVFAITIERPSLHAHSGRVGHEEPAVEETPKPNSPRGNAEPFRRERDLSEGVKPNDGDKPNILFIAIDDLNDHVGYLRGYPGVITPNLDRLAAMGTAFTNAHCAAPICNPSRTSTMFGVRPSTSGVYSNAHQYRQSPVLAEAFSLPEYLRKKHGYSATGAGKIFHALEWIGGASDGKNDPQSWDSFWPTMTRQMPHRVMPENVPLARGDTPGKRRGAPPIMDWGPIGHPVESMPDYKVVSHISDQLGKDYDKPFFLACGIFRPHIPFYVPQKYFDLYPLDQVRLPDNPEDWLQRVPESVRDNAAAGSMRRRWHEWIATNGEWKKAVQAYLASVTFADEQLGRLLDALEDSQHKDDTIIVLWSDHGAHLGDKETWEKYTLWHESTRVPLIFVAPGVTQPGAVCDQPASLLDIYPTLLELTGIEPPMNQLEGTSLVPQLKDPQATKEPVVCTHMAGNHAVISSTHRYIQYANGDEELYDLAADPGEWNNLAQKASLASIKAELRESLPGINFEMTPGRPQANGTSKRGPPNRQRKQPRQRPNFVIIIGDDHGIAHSSPYGLPEYQTPNMQAMADEGIRLTNAYVASPACAPSRAALFTGLMPYRNGIVGNHEHQLRPGVESLIPKLTAAGYDVAFRGKVAHGGKRRQPYLTNEVTLLKGPMKPRLTMDSVAEYLANRPDNKRPLALFIGCTYTHRFWPEPGEARMRPQDVTIPARTFDTPETRSEMTRYAEAVERMDRLIGEVREVAAKHLPPENTLTMYTSDHGQAWPFGKWSLYEAGIRTPMIAVWPKTIPAGVSNDAMVSWIDLFPTLIDLAGGKVPDEIDGRSFSRVLRNATQSHRQQIFATHKGDKAMNVFPIRSVRVGPWKYIRNLRPDFYYTTHMDLVPETSPFFNRNWPSWIEAAKTDAEAATFLRAYHSRPAEELYRLDRDPNETTNLAHQAEYAVKLAEFRGLITRRMKQVNDDESLSGKPRLLVDHTLPSIPE